MPRGRGGLIGLVGQSVGMAAEYREHRKQQKLSRENSQQDDNAVASSSRPQPSARAPSSSSDLRPAYTDVANEKTDRSIASGEPASSNKKAAMAQYDDDDDSSSDDDDDFSVEDDEEDWALDEALSRSNSSGLPSYEESEQSYAPVDDLVREVVVKNRAALSAAPGFDRSPLPCPVIIPQRRPRKKTRGFVRAYAPMLGECSGIDQATFLAFLENFYKSSQASPIFPIIEVAAMIAGFVPSVIAMAVTTAVQVGARVGEEVQSRQRTNTFLDKMNEELFKPAGLYAMIVKYKTDQEVRESGNSLLARFGVSSGQIDFNTNQTIAKYNHALSDESTGNAGSKSMSDRMKNLRLASGTTQGQMRLPDAAPLIFPDIDDALAKGGEETFKDKAKDAKSFLADYMDRRAQMQYARDDPNSNLAVPESQRAFRSKLADPQHPMYNGGIVGFVSGGALTRERMPRQDRMQRRRDKDERRMLRYEQRMAGGRGLIRKKQRRYERILADEEYYGRGRYGDRGGYGYDDGYGYGGRPAGRRGRGGPIGLVGGLLSAAAGGRGNSNEAAYGGRSREYEDTYGRRADQYGYGDEKAMRRSFDDRSNAPAPHAAYGGRPEPYDGNSGYGYGGQAYRGRRPETRRQRSGGIVGTVKRVMKEDVLYLMIVNMPSEAELAEATEALARAKSGR